MAIGSVKMLISFWYDLHQYTVLTLGTSDISENVPDVPPHTPLEGNLIAVRSAFATEL